MEIRNKNWTDIELWAINWELEGLRRKQHSNEICTEWVMERIIGKMNNEQNVEITK